MAKGTGSSQDEAAVYQADLSNIVKDGEEKELEGAAKKQWHARQRKAKRDAERLAKPVEFWYELHGNKLLKKVTKKNGGLYTFYISNVAKESSCLDSQEVREHAKGETLLAAIKKRK